MSFLARQTQLCTKHASDREALLSQAAASATVNQKRKNRKGDATASDAETNIQMCLKKDLVEMEVNEHSAFITILKDFCKTSLVCNSDWTGLLDSWTEIIG